MASRRNFIKITPLILDEVDLSYSFPFSRFEGGNDFVLIDFAVAGANSTNDVSEAADLLEIWLKIV